MDARSTPQHKIIVRLRRIEGQIRGIQALIDKGEGCEAVAQQMAAARKALDKAFYEMISCSLQMEIEQDSSPASVHEATQHITRLLAKYG